MNEESMRFTVFMIHALAKNWNKPYRFVYKTLDESGILDEYIVPCYDVLHTQGERYLVEDVTGFVKEKGYQI